MALEKAVDLPCPLAGQERADRIDQASARADQIGAYVQQALLNANQSVEPLRSEPPAAFGIAAPRSASGAGRVDEDHVSHSTPAGEIFKLVRWVEQACFDHGACPLGAGSKLGETRAIAVRGQDRSARSRRRQGQRLAPCPRAQVDNPLACFRFAGERDELAALVLDFDLPGFEAGFALDAAVGRESNAPRTDLRRHRIDKLLE